MDIGLIGLGKMGSNLAKNLLDHHHNVVANDVNPDAVDEVKAAGGVPAYSVTEVVNQLESPRAIWLMVPAGDVTKQVVTELRDQLEAGDVIIDGGNSNYKESLARAEELKEKGIHFIDAGTSGGVEGARNGACIMIGGDREVVAPLEDMFFDITIENGYLHAGEVGSGHFLKMVHNGIEYGMMQAIAEGFEILNKSDFNYDYEEVARMWNSGSVIRSWLMELVQSAFAKDDNLDQIRGVMNSSGEGKWTVETALDFETPAPVIALSLMMRFRSQEDDTFTGKVVAALRNEFGGHDVVEKS
ncbi:6-phosphogluconate dehydrogenase (decarboxylating) [Salsuginibacillus halophilus]|uniref:6-phosphogluconate dehydrogenase (Decarboxylating) n=1 Tax=Salsuginibacillus halophilus TaxID=517424 RepID=A0A2P8HQS6_9BACI|nr:decarboxylating 6-phosphogluconate dehydrogenase [Salsuginibacillus halophilus]PSL48534.1 6-phosphogluconate dehydrogenase (decarboxylating) [Salsuginibacillus halophilus]